MSPCTHWIREGISPVESLDAVEKRAIFCLEQNPDFMLVKHIN
jgi:hypothetical protein